MTELKLPPLNSTTSGIIYRISELLAIKSRKENIPQNEHNKTALGGVNFWFATAHDNTAYLVYDSNPESWVNEKLELIKQDLENMEWILIYRFATF